MEWLNYNNENQYNLCILYDVIHQIFRAVLIVDSKSVEDINRSPDSHRSMYGDDDPLHAAISWIETAGSGW
jgi:hypothetical protein